MPTRFLPLIFLLGFLGLIRSAWSQQFAGYSCNEVMAQEVGQCHTAIKGGAPMSSTNSNSLAGNAANLSAASSALRQHA